MLRSEKCEGCVHEPVCGFKSEYKAACEAIEEASYTIDGQAIMHVKDAPIDVKVGCPHSTPMWKYRPYSLLNSRNANITPLDSSNE